MAVMSAFKSSARFTKSSLMKRSVSVVDQVMIAKDAAIPTWVSNNNNKVEYSDGEELTPAEGTMMNSPVFKFMDFLFGIPIIHDVMFGVYRKQIVEKSEKMGLPWTEFMDEQWENLENLKGKADDMLDKSITIPDYYYAPIHAYKDGNLCWESAMEEDLWSKLMIAPLYDGALDGDVRMRQKWLDITSGATKGKVEKATDLGCGTGLSMYMLDSKFPTLNSITGVDLSTFKLAICEDKKDILPEAKANKYNLYMAPAEESQVESDSQDLVSLCLVAHESPEWVSKNIFKEAYRILRPGGSFTMLDLDKENLENLLTNPFVAAVYKRTEPYMADFLALDPRSALEEIGFQITEVDQASRSHRVYVAQKPMNA
jgi:ubiquinone/menaquinone biosynthesis C-methylase UbiE